MSIPHAHQLGECIVLLSFFRAGGWTCVAIIVVLSLVPGNERPYTGLPGQIGHIIAYCGAASSRTAIPDGQGAIWDSRDAHIGVGSGAAMGTRPSLTIHRLCREYCWSVSWHVGGGGRGSPSL
jgi:hypothetical protein